MPKDARGSRCCQSFGGAKLRPHGQRAYWTGLGDMAENRAGPLVVELTLESGERLAGSLNDGKQAVAFSGWLGLAEVIDQLRTRAGYVASSPSPGEEHPSGAEAP